MQHGEFRVFRINDTDNVLQFESLEFPNIRLFPDGRILQQEPNGMWRETSLVQDVNLSARMGKAIHTATVGNLDSIRWVDARIADIEQDHTMEISAHDAHAITALQTAYKKDKSQTFPRIVLGMVFPKDPTAFRVFLRNDNTVWICVDSNASWEPVDMPIELVRTVYDATAHLHVSWARRIQKLKQLNPQLDASAEGDV